MKQKADERSWISVLLSYAFSSRWKMIFSFISVAGGFVPYICLYQIIQLFIFKTPDVQSFLFWCGIAASGYLIHYLFFWFFNSTFT